MMLLECNTAFTCHELACIADRERLGSAAKARCCEAATGSCLSGASCNPGSVKLW